METKLFRSWQIRNFKSFKSPEPLELSKINILAGANSSGKSTLIQSILLLKQTIQYGSEERAVALNGPLLRMGEFRDVRNFDEEGANISVQFDLAPEFFDDLSTWSASAAGPTAAAELQEVSTIKVSFEVGEKLEREADGSFKSTLVLWKSELRTLFEDKPDRSITLDRRADSDEATPPPLLLQFVAGIDDESLDELGASRPKLSVAGGVNRHFMPEFYLLRYDAAAQNAAELAVYLCSSGSSMQSRNKYGEQIVPASAVAAVNEWLAANKATEIRQAGPLTANEIRHRIAPLLWGSSLAIRSVKGRSDSISLRSVITDALVSEIEPSFTFDVDTPRIFHMANAHVRNFFQRGIRYLGPLRDAPRPVYPLEALESPTDVGYRGEHTAAVFQLNSSNTVETYLPPNPEDFNSDYTVDATSANLTLHDAAVAWLTYLGVADEVKSTDSGVFGNRLQVATGNVEKWHDLTNVGVGVSQVLPLVVTSLLAPRGSLLIFEQPELHLHPRVQARLADFFIALALGGKQMLLETHSEYLIDRMRLRIALSESDVMRSMVNIQFTEKTDGETHLVPIEVSEYGAVANWPKDFFDQSQKDVARLLKAATKKRSKKNSVQ